MQERDREKLTGDVSGPTRGDFTHASEPEDEFTDWDNPEDEIEEEWEDAPDDYDDAQTGGRPAEEEVDEEFEVDPDDPDYDLSEAAGYSSWEDRGPRQLIPPWLVVVVSLLLILALLLPALIRFN